jgi:pimeloyl-ACP methyl ester carboxylesterase
MTAHVVAGVLDVAYETHGDPKGWPVVLVHGFPYDIHAYDDVAPRLAAAGAFVVVPYMRGYGPTTFLSPDTPRSGEQAAFGADLLALIDALGLKQPIVGGYDWGGRAACVVAALWPERVAGLVTCGGYNIQDIARSGQPAAPDKEVRLWYQYYFHGERGRAGLTKDRHAFCRLLWSLWSPVWHFAEATYERTAASFDNADFIDVVIHSYRHRYALVPGDPAYAEIEAQLARQPRITAPTIALFGEADGVTPADAGLKAKRVQFTGRYEERYFAAIGHNLPQEAPEAFAQAVMDLRSPSREVNR